MGLFNFIITTHHTLILTFILHCNKQIGLVGAGIKLWLNYEHKKIIPYDIV